jgi:hypothetical protein
MTAFVLSGLPSGARSVAVNGVERAVDVPPGVAADALFVAQTVIANSTRRHTMSTASDTPNGTRTVAMNTAQPPIFRGRYRAGPGSAGDRAVSSLRALSKLELAAGDAGRDWMLRDGALDGATAHVYRDDGAALSLVRTDTVAAFRARGWMPLQRVSNYITDTAFEFRPLLDWKPGATIWLSVAAVDAGGAFSPASPALAITIPDPLPSGANAFFGEASPVVDWATDSATLAAAPANFTAAPSGATPGFFDLSWDPTPGAVGYVPMWSEVDPSALTRRQEAWIDLVGDETEPLREGDYVVVSKVLAAARADTLFTAYRYTEPFGQRSLSVDGFPREDHNAGYSDLSGSSAGPFYWNENPAVQYEVRAFGPGEGDGITDRGAHYLRMTVADGATARFGMYDYDDTGQTFRPTLEVGDYRHSVCMRRDSGTGVVTLVAQDKDGIFGGADSRQAIAPTGVWAEHSGTHTIQKVQTGGAYGEAYVEIVGPAVVDLLNMRFLKVTNPQIGFMDILPADVAEFAAFDFLRFHHTVKLREKQYDPLRLLGPSTFPGGSLHGWFTAARDAGSRPWFQISAHFSPEEWRAVVEWLAAPAGSGPWADLRASKGQAAPWSDVFDEMVFEMGNELYLYSIDPPFDFSEDGALCGRWFQHVIDQMKASPYWPALDGKLKFALGGWKNKRAWNRVAWGACPDLDIAAIAPYIAGWESTSSVPAPDMAGFQEVLGAFAETSIRQLRDLLEDVATVRAARAAAGNARTLKAWTYESGPGFSFPGSGQPNPLDFSEPANDRLQEERLMTSQASAVATARVILQGATDGIEAQNWFIYSRGERWNAKTPIGIGGVDKPGYQVWKLCSEHFSGEVRRVAALQSPITSFEGWTDQPAVTCFQCLSGDQLALAVINTDTAAAHSVCVHLPIRTAAELTFHRMIGGASDTVWVPDGAAALMETGSLTPPADCRVVAIDAALGATAAGLPPASVLFLVFSGVSA